MQKLFLSHYSVHAQDVRLLATALRLRGVVPWIDKDRGFRVADDSTVEARRALTEDCFGLALWATEDAFDRPFIRDVELPHALALNADDTHFLLFAIPVGITFEQLRNLSLENFESDLSRFHTVAIPTGEDLSSKVEEIARQVMRRRLSIEESGVIAEMSIQVSTRETMPVGAKDQLLVDACELFQDGAAYPESWAHFIDGLRDVKAEISHSFGRPRICVSGSRHLCATFALGRVFSPFDLNVRQTSKEVWASDFPELGQNPFEATVEYSGSESGIGIVEVASGRKNIRAGVQESSDSRLNSWAARISLRPSTPLAVDNGACVSMARQAYAEIERAVTSGGISELHVFAAVPGSFMAFLGRLFRGMPATTLYEWEHGHYVSALTVPGVVL